MALRPKIKQFKTFKKRYFGTDGIRGRVGTWPITAEFVLKLGWAVGKVLSKQGTGKVLIGKDTRISGYMFESVLEAGLSAAGIDTHLLGPMPTPAIAYLTRTFRAQAGIVISASHNPYYDNGIKFFSSLGTKLPDELEIAIEKQLDEEMTTVDSAKLGKAVRVIDAPGRYIEFCKSTVNAEVSLLGLKIVVDCAHGATYHIAASVFKELGAKVIEIGVEPDGLNINLESGATHPHILSETVLTHRANLGIAFDGDGDRVVMVDHTGAILDGDDLLLIIAAHKLQRKCLLGGVVGTVMSNMGFEHALAQMGLDFVRVSVGDRHVIAELTQRKWYLGGEPSGHIVCLQETTTGDGIVTALQVLAAMQFNQKSLAETRVEYQKYPQKMINIKIAHPIALDTPVIQKAVSAAELELGKAGRVLLRASGTEPLVRIMVEGKDDILVHQLAHNLAQTILAEDK